MRDKKPITCPHCSGELNIGALLGARTSRAKAKAARANGRKGGRPRKTETDKALDRGEQ